MMNVSEELARLAKLRDDGVLTEGEFQTQKAAVLAGGSTSTPPIATKPKKSKLAGCLIAIAIVVALLIVIASLGKPSATNDVQAPTAVTGASKADESPAADTQSPGVTMAGYNKLKNGMTFEQVTAIIGKPTQEMSRNEIAGTETVLYMWDGGFGANMNAMFQNNKLIQKAQMGLR